MFFVKLLQVNFFSSSGDLAEGDTPEPGFNPDLTPILYFFYLGFKNPLILTPLNMDPRSATGLVHDCYIIIRIKSEIF